MPDLLFTDPDLAALYDAFSPRRHRSDFDFYLPYIMSADSVLDVGCGTGSLLHEARDKGHNGRLVGLDPAEGMLEQARKRNDVEWVPGDLSSTSWNHEFDFIVMTGHAFQVLLTDEELQAALAAIRAALTEAGKFGFETRNPAAREWKRWPDQYTGEIRDAAGATVRSECSVDLPSEHDLVSFTHTFTSAAWERPRVSHSTLRFLDGPTLAEFLGNAGLEIAEQYGDWDRSTLSDASPEIITVAQPR